jgi:hypothetical protein
MPETAHYAPSLPPAQQTAGDRLLFAEGDLLVTPTHLQARSWTIATAAITAVKLREENRLVAALRQPPGMLVALVLFALLAFLGLFLVRPLFRVVVGEDLTRQADLERAVALFFVGLPLLTIGTLGVLLIAPQLRKVRHLNATVTLHTAGGNIIPRIFSDPDTARRFRRAVEEAMRLHD